MPSFLLTIFLVQLCIHLLNTVGATVFGEWLWIVYNKLPTSSSTSFQEAAKLRREAVALKAELDKTSAQDQFAKWAKLQRQYDKRKAEYDAQDVQANELRAHETTFKSTASVARWLIANGSRFILQWYYGNVPIFWLPKGWVPTYIEWILSFPKAPMGSIGIQMWFIACSSVIAIAAEGFAAVWALGFSAQPTGAAASEKTHAGSTAEKEKAKKDS